MQLYRPLQVSFAVGHIATIIITTIILFVISLIYYFNVRKVKAHEAPSKFVILFSSIIYLMRGLVASVISPKHTKLTPYFLLIFLWFSVGNIVVLFGFKEAATALTVPLLFAVTTWIGSQVVAVKYQKWSYFNKFTIGVKLKKVGIRIPLMINPLEIIAKVVPIISLTFRMWGNISAGAIIYALLWWSFGGFFGDFPQVGVLLIAATIIMPFIFGYFAVFAGSIQAFVFSLLSITYWGQEINEGIAHHEHLAHERHLRQQAKLAKALGTNPEATAEEVAAAPNILKTSKENINV